MSRNLGDSRSGEQMGQAMGLLALLTLVGVLAPLFAFAQGLFLLLAVSTVVAVSAVALAIFALTHGLVDGGEEPQRERKETAARFVWPVRDKLPARLRRVDIFQPLNSRELGLVANIGEVRSVSAGEQLARAGHLDESIYAVLDGELELLSGHAAAERRPIIIGPGEATPLVAMPERPRSVTEIRAVADGVLFVIPRVRFLELCELQPVLGLRVYRAAAGVMARRFWTESHPPLPAPDVAPTVSA